MEQAFLVGDAVGVVGGEEDGVENAINDKLYSTPEDAIATVRALGSGENGYYMTARKVGSDIE